MCTQYGVNIAVVLNLLFRVLLVDDVLVEWKQILVCHDDVAPCHIRMTSYRFSWVAPSPLLQPLASGGYAALPFGAGV